MSLLLEEREALLRAIFDSPEDNSPRMIYADSLEDHGEQIHAELIRIECEDPQYLNESRRRELLAQITSLDFSELPPRDRGFWANDVAAVDVSDLQDAERFRSIAALQHPEWFGARTLRIEAGRITDANPLDTIYRSMAFRRLTRFDFGGRLASLANRIPDDLDVFPEYSIIPVITNAGVDALAKHRISGRIEELILTNNELGNDALRFLARSPYFGSLKRLEIREGHSFRGRVWQQLLERFGEDSVS